MVRTESTATCSQCQRHFSRLEHLRRHLKTHTLEKPFACRYCRAKFSRRDVYQRHLRSSHQEASPLPARHDRVRQACDTCHERKLKCDKMHGGCSRCRSNNTLCTFTRLANLPRLAEDTTTPASDSQGVATASSTTNDNQSVEEHETYHHSAPPFDAGHCGGAERLPPLSPESFANVIQFPDFSNHDNLIESDFYMAPSMQESNATYDLFPCGYNFDLLSESINNSQLNWLDPAFTGASDIPMTGILPHESELDRRRNTAFTKLREYSNAEHPSRPGSPEAANAHARWLDQLGQKQNLLCGKVMANVLGRLFQAHAPTPFIRMINYSSGSPMHELPHLATAAVGALYCDAFGSKKISTWLHHLTRQKLLNLVYGNLSIVEPTLKLAILQTVKFALMELFVYLSGDKRLPEVTDSSHGRFIQTIRLFKFWQPVDGVPEIQRRSFFDALTILESYRVLLYQRPTSLQPLGLLDNILCGISGSNSLGYQGLDDGPLSQLLRYVITSSTEPVEITSSEMSFLALCRLTLLIPSFKSQEPTYSRATTHPAIFGDWRICLELIFNRWLCCHRKTPINHSCQLLYHTIHLNIHSDLLSAQRGVQRLLILSSDSTLTSSGGSEVIRSLYGEINDQLQELGLASSVNTACFNSDHERMKASWHANRILVLAEEASTQRAPSGETLHGSHASENFEGTPSPHSNYAVFFASLVLWCASVDVMLQSTPSSPKFPGLETSCLRRGSALLSNSNVIGTTAFQHVLRSLTSLSEAPVI